MRQNRRTLSLVRRLAFGRQAAGSIQCQEPRMFWRPERGAVKLDSGSQERLGGRLRATALGVCPGTGSLPHWRTPRRGPLTPALSRWEREQNRCNAALGMGASRWRTPRRGPLTSALSRWEREQDWRNAALGIAGVWIRRFFEITLTDYHLLSFLWSVVRNEIPHPKPRSSTTLLCFAPRFEGAPAGVVPC